MNFWLNNYIEISALAIFLAGFVFVGWKNIKHAILAVIFFLPLYLVRIQIFFLPLNVLEILVWLVAIIWLIRGRYKDIDWAKMKRLILSAAVILAGAVLATIFSANLIISLGILKGWFLVPMVLALVAVSELRSKEDIINALTFLFMSSAIVALIALGDYFKNQLTFDQRLTAFYLSPNHLAMYLAPGFLAGLAVWRAASGTRTKILVGLAQVLIGLALYLTFSYGAWLAILAGISVQWLVMSDKKEISDKCSAISDKARRKKKMVIVVAFLCVAAFLFLTQISSLKLNNLLQSNRSSLQSRLMIWQAAWLIGRDHLVVGIGPGMFQTFYLRYQKIFPSPYLEWAVPEPHSLFLAFWLETGLVGLVGFLWLIINFFRKIFPEKKHQPFLAAGLVGIMVYTLVHGLIDTPYFKNDLAVIFWLVVALACCLSWLSNSSRTPDCQSD